MAARLSAKTMTVSFLGGSAGLSRVLMRAFGYLTTLMLEDVKQPG
jgi:hypothetical protein